MRKKDFNAIAGQIKLYHKNDTNPLTPKSNRTAENIAYDFAFLLEQHDPKFDKQKFLTACGIESNVHEWVRDDGTHVRVVGSD